jgi:MerC mercury resistance protein
VKDVIKSLDRIGSIGALLTAIAAPCCFPLFATIGATVGLGALAQYEGIILYLFHGFAFITLMGLLLAFLKHRNIAPLVLGTIACVLLTYHFYRSFSLVALYGGLLALTAATAWNYFITRRGKALILASTITCPNCGHRATETMPTNACVFFYDCPGCKTRLKPNTGDCCVFCSYGSVPCPPIQTGSLCCSSENQPLVTGRTKDHL